METRIAKILRILKDATANLEEVEEEIELFAREMDDGPSKDEFLASLRRTRDTLKDTIRLANVEKRKLS